MSANDFDRYTVIGVPDVPLDDYLFLNFRFHIVFKVQSFERVKLLSKGKSHEIGDACK